MAPVEKKLSRTNIEISIKKDVINDRQNGDTFKIIGERYSLSIGAVSNIWRNRNKISNKNFAPGVVVAGNVNKRSNLTEAMEIQVISWLKADEQKCRNVTAKEICQQAKQIHSLLLQEKLTQPSSSNTPDEPPFAASTGWLRRFHRRMRKASTASGKRLYTSQMLQK